MLWKSERINYLRPFVRPEAECRLLRWPSIQAGVVTFLELPALAADTESVFKLQQVGLSGLAYFVAE